MYQKWGHRLETNLLRLLIGSVKNYGRPIRCKAASGASGVQPISARVWVNIFGQLANLGLDVSDLGMAPFGYNTDHKPRCHNTIFADRCRGGLGCDDQDYGRDRKPLPSCGRDVIFPSPS